MKAIRRGVVFAALLFAGSAIRLFAPSASSTRSRLPSREYSAGDVRPVAAVPTPHEQRTLGTRHSAGCGAWCRVGTTSARW